MLSVFKTNIKIIFLTGCITLLLSSAGFAAQNRVIYKGIVASFKLNIRKAPSFSSSIINVVKKGQAIDVLEEKGGIGGWLKVSYEKDIGYVRNRPIYIRLIPVVPKKQKKIKVKKLKKFKKETVEEQKQDILTRIQTQEEMAKTFSRKEIAIIEGLNEVDYKVNQTRKKVLALAKEIKLLKKKTKPLNLEREQLFKEITRNREYAAKRVRALHKMNMIGRLGAAELPVSVFDFFIQQNSMKRIIKADFQVLEKQILDLEKFEKLEQALQKKIQARTSLEAESRNQIRINKKETLKKELILREIRKKKNLSLAAVDSLKHAALQLDNKIKSMQKDSKAKASSDFSFPSYQGQLLIPAKGKVISRYGPARTGDYKSFTFQKGIDIKVEKGEPVKSVFKGEIMFAQWLKGYGNLLIINHGGNYYTLYAHVEEIFKQKGESVETGEVIATAGDTGSIKGACLHFEVRHHGRPLNPLKWLRKGA